MNFNFFIKMSNLSSPSARVTEAASATVTTPEELIGTLQAALAMLQSLQSDPNLLRLAYNPIPLMEAMARARNALETVEEEAAAVKSLCYKAEQAKSLRNMTMANALMQGINREETDKVYTYPDLLEFIGQRFNALLNGENTTLHVSRYMNDYASRRLNDTEFAEEVIGTKVVFKIAPDDNHISGRTFILCCQTAKDGNPMLSMYVQEPMTKQTEKNADGSGGEYKIVSKQYTYRLVSLIHPSK